jgi:sugar-specific transcriptional regulator TrmB
MSLERIFKALVKLGLTEIDARVYIFLATKEPNIARNIAEALKTNKQQIYLSLKRLQAKEIVNSNNEQPAIFSALPFEKALNKLIDAKTEEAQNIEQNKEELLAAWRAQE